MRRNLPRRRLLELTGVGVGVGLAGCSQQSDEDSTAEPTTETSTRTAGSEPTTGTTDTTSTTTTELDITVELDLRTPSAVGTVAYDLSVTASQTLAEVGVSTAAATTTHSVDDTTMPASGTIDATPGRLNEVVVSVTTADGRQVTQPGYQYARMHEPAAESSVDIGAVYVPFMGGGSGEGKWEDCAVGTPRVGTYSTDERDYSRSNREAVARHLDQQHGHGVGPVMFNFGEEIADYGRFNVFQDSDLATERDFECFYVLIQALRRNRAIEDDLRYVRDQMFTLDNYSTLDGRPLVQIWGGYAARWHLEDNPLFEDKSLVEHVEWLRETLTPPDGPAPFLVTTSADYGRWVRRDDADPDETTTAYMAAFDGYTTWFPHLESSTETEWEAALETTEAEFAGLRSVADADDKAVIPTVYPGFDDRANTCWGEDRYLPRRVDRFRELFALADEYRTHDRINVASWNDWNEGHMIEPGTYNDTQYGTRYLDVIRDRYHEA